MFLKKEFTVTFYRVETAFGEGHPQSSGKAGKKIWVPECPSIVQLIKQWCCVLSQYLARKGLNSDSKLHN